MDDANETPRRERSAAVRRHRLSSSMSQRLEEIVAQLMRPIHNLKQNFDIDLSLLEEYLTEMGVRQLNGVTQDFTTVAMLVQQCAHIYGKKVDFYEQSVYDMVERSAQLPKTLSCLEIENGEGEDNSPTVEAEARTGRKRKKKQPEGAFRDFGPIDLEPAANISREEEPVRQPPTLPKTYIEFERPPVSERDARLTDYFGNEIGIPSDFHVNWSLNDGMIVDDLDSSAAVSRDMVVPIHVAVLDEIRRLSPPVSGSDSGVGHTDNPEPPDDRPPPLPPGKDDKRRKRKSGKTDMGEGAKRRKLTVTDSRIRSCRATWETVRSEQVGSRLELSACEAEVLECVETRWHRNLLARGIRILATSYDLDQYQFKGFSNDRLRDRTGMKGFKSNEIREAEERRALWVTYVRTVSGSASTPFLDSDDDGFFEMSDTSHLHDTSHTSSHTSVSAVQPSEERQALTTSVEAWHAMVAPRVAEAESRSAFDVHDYSRRILARLPAKEPRPFSKVAQDAPQHEVCRYFLATLFLANTGNVEIRKTGAPLSMHGFEVKLISQDKSLYSSANPFE